jgi:hydrogenase expression/formation protein HypE
MSTPTETIGRETTVGTASGNGSPSSGTAASRLSPLRDELVTLKHGAGGLAMRRLIKTLFVTGMPETGADWLGLQALDDGAAIRLGEDWLVLTTDSHVIHPITFPGGDIGRLAVAGTVNDLAVMGATTPLGLTCAVIVEEGFPIARLEQIQESIRATCREAGVAVVTGDTKVMGRGEIDGIVINTTGVGLTRTLITDAGLRAGDRIIVTGPIGDHGIALMAKRHDLDLGDELKSDVAPVHAPIASAIAVAPGAIHSMKDPTRGGLSGALHEMAAKSGLQIVIEEAQVPVSDAARSAAEILGLDPFVIANEGKAVLGVAPDAVNDVIEALRRHTVASEAAVIGECGAGVAGRVVLDTGLGRRLLPEIEGEPLPRIC